MYVQIGGHGGSSAAEQYPIVLLLLRFPGTHPAVSSGPEAAVEALKSSIGAQCLLGNESE